MNALRIPNSARYIAALCSLAALIPAALILAALTIAGCSAPNPRTITTPNRAAAIHGNLPENPLRWKIITSSVDRQHGTMSTLFGNDSAVAYARSHADHNYPAGSTLAFVTWKQQEDERWFGANIPAAPQSIEFLTVRLSPDHSAAIDYRVFRGSPLQEAASQENATTQDRIRLILAPPVAYMP